MHFMQRISVSCCWYVCCCLYLSSARHVQVYTLRHHVLSICPLKTWRIYPRNTRTAEEWKNLTCVNNTSQDIQEHKWNCVGSTLLERQFPLLSCKIIPKLPPHFSISVSLLLYNPFSMSKLRIVECLPAWQNSVYIDIEQHGFSRCREVYIYFIYKYFSKYSRHRLKNGTRENNLY